MKTNFPDYKKSIVNLASSIENDFSLNNKHNTLEVLDKKLAHKYKNVIVMLFDGMGEYNINMHLPKDSFLQQHKIDIITSTYPPTTVAATTSVQTALEPSENAYIGWTEYIKELDSNVKIFPNVIDEGPIKPDYSIAEKYTPYVSITERIKKAGLFDSEIISPFGTVYSDSLEDNIKFIKEYSKKSGRHYLYAYYPEPDHNMHQLGVDSVEVHDIILDINKKVEELCSELKDSIVIVISDHGHINCENLCIKDYPNVYNLLKRDPSIEPRTLSFFVKDGKKEEFRKEYLKEFGDISILLTREEVFEKNIFGHDNSNIYFRDMIGDFVACMTTSKTLFSSKEEVELFKGAHAGLTKEEMEIPLIVIEKK